MTVETLKTPSLVKAPLAPPKTQPRIDYIGYCDLGGVLSEATFNRAQTVIEKGIKDLRAHQARLNQCRYHCQLAGIEPTSTQQLLYCFWREQMLAPDSKPNQDPAEGLKPWNLYDHELLVEVFLLTGDFRRHKDSTSHHPIFLKNRK